MLGLDLGTSAVHCLLAGGRGEMVSAASAPVSYLRPPNGSQLAREFDPAHVMSAMAVAVGETLRGPGIAGARVSAIGITSQRHGLVGLDREGREIYCSPNLDVQGVFEGAAIDEEFGPRIYRTTGHFPSILLAPARLRWLRSSDPARYQRLDRVLSMAAWVAYRLTGSAAAEASLECEAGLADVTTKGRCPDLMEALQVPSSLLPPISGPGDAAGRLACEHADALGMRADTPVFLAGADSQCGLVGMGVVRPGATAAVLGWSGALQSTTARPRFHDAMRTWVGCLPGSDGWVVESNLGDAGNAYRWLKDTLLGKDADFAETEALARGALAAPEGVMALLGPGPVASVRVGLRRGGILFPTPLSFQEVGRGQMFRAALESLAFCVEANLEAIGEVTNARAGPLHLGGGMASSDTLAGCLATVMDRPVLRPAFPQVSARGAAMLAAHWSLDADLEESARLVSRELRPTEPGGPSEVAQYREHYQEWLDLSRRLEWARD